MASLPSRSNRVLPLIALIALLPVTLQAIAAPEESTASAAIAVRERFSPLPDIMEEAWRNPALISHHYAAGLSEVGGGCTLNQTDRFGEFKAHSYMRPGRVTIDAAATYRNGARHNLRACENADVEKVYPYLTYDTIGGNQNLERYIFGGIVGVRIGEKWGVGGGLSYDAGLLYRNRDPRPRIVTGDMRIVAGGAFDLMPGYAAGIALDYEKYKQSCDITFMSELGAAKIYHLTGLGSHYYRFAGRGNSTYFNGNSFGLALTLLPLREGFYADIRFRKEKMLLILEDLNNLPMSRLDGCYLTMGAGYRWRSIAIVGHAEILRRHGYENIFGDAASGHYPLIGSVAMHLLNRDRYALRTAGELTWNTLMLAFSGGIDWSRYSEYYRDPAKSLRISILTPAAECKVMLRLSTSMLLHASVAYGISMPLGSSLSLLPTEGTEGFTSILEEGFRKTSCTFHEVGGSIGADIFIRSGRFAIGVDTGWNRRKLTGDTFIASLLFKF